MDETPPNTPQRARAAARQNERTNRNLDTPQHRRTPQNPGSPQIAPLQFNIPIPPGPPALANAPIPEDPFAPAAIPVQQYQHLPHHLAQQLQNLPALAPVRGRGHGRGNVNGPLVPVSELDFT